MPDSLGAGRTARNVSFRVDTGDDWVAEVDVVLEGEQEISEEEYWSRRSANTEYIARIPERVVEPTPLPVVDPTVSAKGE
ncbi:MAG: hypothetical protein IT299_11095 [Dehalococcoidia bacterium]|nr:hypothetical protein [Dehalococcoidia bacterium]